MGRLPILLWCICWAAELSWGQAERVFFGNLHSHTSYSDGSGTPDDAYQHARNVARLDFLAITEHNHSAAESGASADRRDGILIATNPSLYNGSDPKSLLSTAARFHQDGVFAAIYGQEFSSISKGNHVNVFEVPNVITVPNGDFGRLIDQWLPNNLDSTGAPAIIQFNHPALLDNESNEYGADDFPSPEEWIRKMGAHASLIEILNGPAMTRTAGNAPEEVMEGDYLHYLTLGFHLAPTADQDNHYFTWGTATDARTAVITDSLTKPKILEAMRSRHVYATEDKNLRLIFRVNGRLCGDRISPAPAPNSPLQIQYSIQDDDEPQAEYQIEVFRGGIGSSQVARMVNTVPAEGNSNGTIEDVQYTGGIQYVFFKVTQTGEDGDKDRAWTAPVWFEPSGPPPPDVPTGSEAFVASRRSSVFHVSGDCADAKAIFAANRITGAEAARGRRQHQGCPR